MHAAPTLDAPSSATAAAAATSMRAALRHRYGEPDVLSIGEVAIPTPGDDEVLVRVSAAGVTLGDHHMITGRPYLIRLSPYGGLPGPRRRVPGACMAGRVVSLGAKVTAFRVGDAVMGQALSGAFAEYVALPASHLALKPERLSFEEAAAVPWGATALKGLRDAAGLTAGQRVLINGASGAVGSWAVQIAKAYGAVVTAVCSARNVERVRALGADEVIDYTREDFTVGGARFDVVFDTVGNRTLSEFRSVLHARGSSWPARAAAATGSAPCPTSSRSW